MNKKTKKILSICGAILGVSVLAGASAIGIVSCSSTNSTTTTTPTNSSASSSTTNSSSSKTSSSSTSTSSSKTTTNKDDATKSASSSSNSTPAQNTTGLVTLNTFLTTPTTKEAVGQLISTNVYACGSKITLNANYTPPPDVTSAPDETDTITYAWYQGDDLITGQVNSQCNIAGIFSTTTYKVVVTCNVYKQTTTTTSNNTSSSNSTSSSSKSTSSTSSSQTKSISLDDTSNSSSNSNTSDKTSSTKTTGKVTKTLIKTYTCNTTLTVSVDYSNLSATLVYGANQMGTITANTQTALAVNLQYKFEGNGTTQPAGALYSFSSAQLKKLPKTTISFERYSFGQWNQLNAANTSANEIQNLDYSYTPTGIYPLQAQLNIGGYTLKTNILKVNTTYNGSVLDIDSLPASLQSTYNFTTIMLLYLQESLKEDGQNAPFMQLVNAWGHGYMFIQATTSNTYNQVTPSDLTDWNVSWVNTSNHNDGLMISAKVDVANNSGLELMGYANYNNKKYAYTESNNLLIANGDTISWTLPFGGPHSLQWTITDGQVSSVNWDINTYDNNVFYNYGSATSPQWNAYGWACTNEFGYPTIGNTNLYWGYKITNASGTNVLQSLITSNTSYKKQTPNNTTYLLYNDFPMVSTNSANAQTGYVTLTSGCIAILNNLYQASISGIASLENS